jgi:hypothetical protein
MGNRFPGELGAGGEMSRKKSSGWAKRFARKWRLHYLAHPPGPAARDRQGLRLR